MATLEETTPLVRAAERIARADVLLVAAGAGFSADSGLPVYNDIASVAAYEKQGLEYHDLCDPHLLEDDAPAFYGFWGSCLNSYRDTAEHAGYAILRKWKQRLSDASSPKAFQHTFDRLRQRGALPDSVTAAGVTHDPFFVYTSNVDAHFHRVFAAEEIYELHGSLENWQCAGAVVGRQPCEIVWTLPRETRFQVDPESMHSDGPTCLQCGEQARPNVLMFHDKNWHANIEDEDRYVAWEAVMEQMLEDDPSLKLVVLEIGCGKRVPSVRRETEMVVADAFTRCAARHGSESASQQVSLVRINPDFPECDNEELLERDLVVSVRAKALEALTAIDSLLPASRSADATALTQ